MENTWRVTRLDGAELGDLRLRLAAEPDLSGILRMLLDPTTLAAIGESAQQAEQSVRRLWQEQFAPGRLRHLVVETSPDRELIAYLRLEYPFNKPGCLWLTFFCIAPGHRGRGYGRQVMQLLVAEAARSGAVAEFGIHTRASNRAAIRLYTSSGFACVKREPWRSANGDTSDRLTFRQAFAESGDRAAVPTQEQP